MEFFLQTLVRRGHLQQSSMLAMNQLLMLGSSIAAIRVLSNIYYCDYYQIYDCIDVYSNDACTRRINVAYRWIFLIIPFTSLFLNYYNRNKELTNVVICSIIAFILSYKLYNQ